MVRCCGGICLAFKKLMVRCLVNRAGMQKQHLLCCRKCNGEKYMSIKKILQNNFASQECSLLPYHVYLAPLTKRFFAKGQFNKCKLFSIHEQINDQNERLSSVKYLLGLFNNLLDLCKRYYAWFDEKRNFIRHFTNFVCLYSCRLTRTQFSIYQRASYLGILSKNHIKRHFFRKLGPGDNRNVKSVKAFIICAILFEIQ